MAVNSISITQGTQSSILTDQTGGTGGSLIGIMKISMDSQGTYTDANLFQGTILKVNTLGTLPNIPGGSVAVTAGTVNTGTINTGTINTGTINAGTVNLGTVVGKDANAAAQSANPVSIGGTDSGGTVYTWGVDTSGIGRIKFDTGTISSLPNLPQGSIQVTAGTIASLGTMGTVGIVNTVTTVSNLSAGSVNIVAGTIATLGTMGTVGLVNTVTTVSNLTNGSIHVTAGTGIVTSGSVNVIAGTVNTGTINTGTFNTGTINTGTINIGTFQINPLVAAQTISHAGTSGTTGIGTLVGTASIGAGTALYITNYRIVAISGSPEVILAFGSVTNGAQVIHHGLYNAGGGISSPVFYPHGYGTTNSPLTYQILSGAGTVAWDVDYFVHT